MKAKFNGYRIKLEEGWVELPQGWFFENEDSAVQICDQKMPDNISLRETPRERPMVDFFGDSETATYYDLSFEDGISLASIDSRQLEFIEE